MEIPDPIKGSSSLPSAFPSAPPQQDGGNFNYPPPPPPGPPPIQCSSPPIMGIPVMHNFSHHQSPIPWSTGLCDCFDDPANCCVTCWCPCVTFGLIAEITDKGTTSCGMSGTLYALIMFVTGCSFLYSCFYRSKLRSQYFLDGSPCPDCCVHFWCEGCALCQEYRELKNRGFDMSIGWHGNMQRLERQMRGEPVMPPMVQQPMHR